MERGEKGRRAQEKGNLNAGIVVSMVSLIVAVVLGGVPIQDFQFREGLIASPRPAPGRRPVHTDPVEKSIVLGLFQKPIAGTEWRPITADAEGRFRGIGYVFAEYEAPEDSVMLLQAEGNSLVYVNGVIRPGDVYGYGYLRLPVEIKKGANSFLFLSSRGSVRAKLVPVAKPISFDLSDPTLPDFVMGDRNAMHAGLVLTNAGKRVDALTLTATVDGAMRKTWLPGIPSMTVRKVGFQIPLPTRSDKDQIECMVRLMSGEIILDEKTVTLRLSAPSQPHKRTFLSVIDGSVQYYGVRPASPIAGDHERAGIVLTLHGASVEGIGQAEAYASKSWAHVVAPTNRRPYGFDWEDWGRIDAMEVLADAEKTYRTDPARTYLTGHSMGGHGAWQVGVHFPGRFAGVAPSAGWSTFWSYTDGGKKPFDESDPIQEVLSRAANPSDTMLLLPNLEPLPVYILHGDADDNVPPTEARLMATALAKFHKKWTLFEEKGAGHWWDNSDEPGAACVDWPPIFDMFAAARVAADKETRRVRFVTVNPENSAGMHWATVVAQQKQLAPSSIDLLCDPHQRRFSGTTANVYRLAISARHLEAGKPISVAIDGTVVKDIRWPLGDTLLLERRAEVWAVVDGFPPNEKSPARSSGFKNAFDRRMIFVYGTKGTVEENAWSYARARFDSEAFYYRGNGAVDVMPDTSFGSSVDVDRSVVLYGNADSNGAWAALLPNSPISVKRNLVRVGMAAMPGLDSAVIFTRPRPGSLVASVAVVSGSGMPGMRLTERLNYFLAGVHFPDFFVAGPEMLDTGYPGVRAVGYFDNEWEMGSDVVIR
ncbi:MAG: prolyl oligopeptidase family serine peptidase [Armatimonadota bacterium]|nr:prolyl oligopeptidase family serine peptidase [Armatimonadota bacterium]